MCPCDPLDVNLDPSGPSGPALPGFGVPFSLNLNGINDFLDGMPEDLLDLLDKLSLLIPPGALTPNLNPNFGKDAFDAILKLIDQFMPFLMLYKFFMPLLNMIICILEVLCSLNNPFKVIRAIRRLFRNCIPAFLNLFPIFALIIMIISLLLLLLALIEYIIQQILKLIDLILRNLRALNAAFRDGDANSILAITTKIGALLCFFQNLFVLLSVFTAIFQIFRDILKLSASIPPCDNSSGDEDGCCTPDVCPEIVQNDYTRITGTFQYLRAVTINTGLSLPSWYGNFSIPVRSEGWQLFDTSQTQSEEFINIVDAYDIPGNDKPSFFPTDGVYNESSNVRDVPYAVDMKILYNPSTFGRDGYEGRYVTFKDCIVTAPPTRISTNADGTTTAVSQGVFNIVGGLGYEEDGSILLGFESDGITQSAKQATITTFFHVKNRDTTEQILLSSDGYTTTDVEYTFKPNFEFLYKKQLVSAGCQEDLALDKNIINGAYAGDVAVMTEEIKGIMDSDNFPDPQAVSDGLSAALDAFRADMTESGANDFVNTSNAILGKMKDDTNLALVSISSAGISPCDSNIIISTPIQFTTKPIIITVSLNERNGSPLVKGFPAETAKKIANKIIGYTTFGNISRFEYDNSSSFIANLTSNEAGAGILTVSFDNQFLCINTIPQDLDVAPSVDIKEVNFEFVKTTHAGSPLVSDDGQPRRGADDVARDGKIG